MKKNTQFHLSNTKDVYLLSRAQSCLALGRVKNMIVPIFALLLPLAQASSPLSLLLRDISSLGNHDLVLVTQFSASALASDVILPEIMGDHGSLTVIEPAEEEEGVDVDSDPCPPKVPRLDPSIRR